MSLAPQRVAGDGPVAVDVPPAIVERCRAVARRKQELTHAGAIRHRSSYAGRAPFEQAQQDVEAALGEWVVGTMLGQEPDLERLDRGIGDGTVDLYPWRSWRLQIKSSTAWVPHLFTPFDYRTTAHLFVLTWRPAAQVRLLEALVRIHVIGWVTRKMWAERRTTETTTWGTRWRVAREDLEPASTLAFLPDRREAMGR